MTSFDYAVFDVPVLRATCHMRRKAHHHIEPMLPQKDQLPQYFQIYINMQEQQ